METNGAIDAQRLMRINGWLYARNYMNEKVPPGTLARDVPNFGYWCDFIDYLVDNMPYYQKDKFN